MKKLKKLKLNALNEQDLAEKQMNALRGGTTCYCSCYWANQGGSSYSANTNANYNIGSNGGYSTNGCNQYAYQEGENGFGYCPNCNEDINGYGTY
jgi:natural product precursor